MQRHVDYFGTEVLEFEVPKPHDHLTIDVRARVVTASPPSRPTRRGRRSTPPSYAEAAGEFLLRMARGLSDPRLDELQASSPAPPSRRCATLQLLCELVPDHFEYRPGVTYVGSTSGSARGRRRRLPGLRAPLAAAAAAQGDRRALRLGLPVVGARGRRRTTRSRFRHHAWLEALLPGLGRRGEPVWVGADPTNRRLAGETHVKIGHGRLYADVAPIKGVYRGEAPPSSDAEVAHDAPDGDSGRTRSRALAPEPTRYHALSTRSPAGRFSARRRE